MSFIIRDMKIPGGGFSGSISAQDKRGVEGGNYIWDTGEIYKLLNNEQSHWLKNNIKMIRLQISEKELPAGFMQGVMGDEIKAKLLAERQKNVLIKDDKLIISWNAYLLSVMISVNDVVDDDNFKAEAKILYNLIQKQLDKGLVRKNKQRYLEDYVFVINALCKWNEKNFTDDDLKIINDTKNEAIKLFKDNGVWKNKNIGILPVPNNFISQKDGGMLSMSVIMREMFKDSDVTKESSSANDKLTVSNVVVANPVEYSSYIVSYYYK